MDNDAVIILVFISDCVDHLRFAAISCHTVLSHLIHCNLFLLYVSFLWTLLLFLCSLFLCSLHVNHADLFLYSYEAEFIHISLQQPEHVRSCFITAQTCKLWLSSSSLQNKTLKNNYTIDTLILNVISTWKTKKIFNFNLWQLGWIFFSLFISLSFPKWSNSSCFSVWTFCFSTLTFCIKSRRCYSDSLDKAHSYTQNPHWEGYFANRLCFSIQRFFHRRNTEWP